ncbi:hypothetical protein LTR50_003191 [Elasticomyces elasticus]|nr:hypothetical protein LTR50_003191 [Elasticomyces elasticus]
MPPSQNFYATLISESILTPEQWWPALQSFVQAVKADTKSEIVLRGVRDISPTELPPAHQLSNEEKYRQSLNPLTQNLFASRAYELSLQIQSDSRDMTNLATCTALSKGSQLATWTASREIQVVIQPKDLYEQRRTGPGLAVFDMDSTLIQQEVIDELARAIGKYDAVAAITEASMRGEAPYTDFEASLRARVALLVGVPDDIWEQLKKDVITFTPGARELTQALRERGWKTAVLSGGFTPLAEWVKSELGLDYAFANFLASDPETGCLTGGLEAGKPIVHAQRKRELLLSLAEKEGIPVSRTVAVGDGSNDLPMLHTAGLGTAFNAKPKVQEAAPSRLNSRSLEDVLAVLGFERKPSP